MFNRNPKKNTRFAIYAGNPGFSGMVICSDFIGYVKAPSLSDAYDAAYRYLVNSGYTAIVVREACSFSDNRTSITPRRTAIVGGNFYSKE